MNLKHHSMDFFFLNGNTCLLTKYAVWLDASEDTPHRLDWLFNVGRCLTINWEETFQAIDAPSVKQLSVNIPHSHDVFIIQLQSEVVLSVEEHLAHPMCQPTHLRIYSATLIKQPLVS